MTSSPTSSPSSTRPCPRTESAKGTWGKIIEIAARRWPTFADDEASSSSDIIGAAQELRSLVRQYV